MSMPSKQIVSCPNCGKDIEFTMWQSINNEMSFAMPDIISGKLFEVECKNCGLKTHVNYPILVNDMEHKVMIYYTFPDGAEETEKALEHMKKIYTGRTRIVTDQASLREKVGIFNADLDDRIIELLKAIVMAQVQNQLKGTNVQGVYYVVDDNPRFEIIHDHGSGYVPVDMEFYRKVEEEFFNKEALEKDDEVYIDKTWANSFLASFDE